MQQATVTINGFVGAEPTRFGREGGAPGCSLRIGCTPSYVDQSSGQWRDRPTVWMSVKAFRTLALDILQSVHKGDAVVATGTLDCEEWEVDGARRSRNVLVASSFGHDLSRGTSTFVRSYAGRRLGVQNDTSGISQTANNHQAADRYGNDPYASGQQHQLRQDQQNQQSQNDGSQYAGATGAAVHSEGGPANDWITQEDAEMASPDM